VSANLAMLAYAHAAGSDTIKVGLIGCGGRGSGAADNVLHAAPNVKIVAIGDVFKFRVDSCRKGLDKLAREDTKLKELGNSVELPEERCFVGLDAYEKVINSDANYIILATPPGFRPLHLQAAVAAGKNIFTEKPVGVDGPGIRKVLAAYEEADKKGLHIVAGTQRRHQLGYLETLKRIHDGEIGDITSLRCYWNQGDLWFHKRDDLASKGEKATDLAYQLYNWYQWVWTCGDHIVEQHVHNLDVCNWVMGNKHPIRAVGMGSRIPTVKRPQGDPNEVGNIFSFFAIDFEYPGGVHMMSMCRQIDNCANSVSEAVTGTKGFCQVNDYSINGKHVVSRQEGKRGTDPYVQEHTDLIEHIRNGKPINELKTVAESTMTAILGRMSAYTGKPLTWEQALNTKHETMPAPQLAWDMSIHSEPVAIPGKTALG